MFSPLQDYKRRTLESTLCAVSKDELGHKGGHGYVHDACIVFNAVCQKSRAEATLNSEKIKPVALAIIKLVSQAVSQ